MDPNENFELLKILAGNPRTERGRPVAINVCPKGKKMLYCNGNSIFIRDIDDPSDCDVYTEHSKETTCAAYSPSGFYICSGDVSGKIRIWDSVNKQHLLKFEYQVISGRIRDIVWSDDSKKIAVCGDGRGCTAAVIHWDSGASCGTLSGPTKGCNSISLKQSRPYRLAVVSEDYSSTFFEGVPFKFKSQFYENQNFVNCVRFSPDGSKFATADADGRCFIHDGITGEFIEEINNSAKRAHEGGIYGIAWNYDGNYLMTVSGDKTVKVWNMSEACYLPEDETVTTFVMGSEVDDMQVGCAWSNNILITVSLNSYINYLNPNDNSCPKRVIKGHTKPIVTSCLSGDRRTLFTSSFDGIIYHWDLVTGEANLVEGCGHTNKVQNMHCIGSTIVTCGIDDCVRCISVDEKRYIEDIVIKLDVPPLCVATGNDGMTVLACLGAIVVLKDEKVAQVYKIEDYLFTPTCIAISSSLGKVAVGTNKNQVKIYDIVDDKLEKKGIVFGTAAITDVQFSPDEKYLGFCTGSKLVKVVSTSNYKAVRLAEKAHTVKVNAISWSPDSCYLASCGVEGKVFIWSMEEKKAIVEINGAHSQSVDVTSVQWMDNKTILTTGRDDCSIKMWRVGLDPFDFF